MFLTMTHHYPFKNLYYNFRKW